VIVAQITSKTAFRSPIFAGWRVTVGAGTIAEAEAEAAKLGHVADIIPAADQFEALVIEDRDGPPESVILAMHWRYEAAGEAISQLDQMRPTISENRKFISDSAQSAVLREQDALRLGIIQQVPNTWDEAAAMLFHMSNSYDLLVDAESKDRNEREEDALRIGFQNLFDFIVGEKIDGRASLGQAFSAEATRCEKLVRVRSGHGEG
jgi:hypothetical protein